MSPKEEREMLDWKLSHGIMTKKELLLYFNPDMDDAELEAKLDEINTEKQTEREAQQPQSAMQRILNGAS